MLAGVTLRIGDGAAHVKLKVAQLKEVLGVTDAGIAANGDAAIPDNG